MSTQPLAVEGHDLAVVHVDPQLPDAVRGGARASQHGHSWKEEERVDFTGKAVLKFVEYSLFYEVPEQDVTFAI